MNNEMTMLWNNGGKCHHMFLKCNRDSTAAVEDQ